MCRMLLNLLLSRVLFIAILSDTLAVDVDYAVAGVPSSSVGGTAPTTTAPKAIVETRQYKSEMDIPSSSTANHRKLRTDILVSSFEHMKRHHPLTKFHSMLDQAIHRSKIFSDTQHQQGKDTSKADVDVHEEEEEYDQEGYDDEEDEGGDFERLLRKKNGSKSKSPKHPKKMKYPNSSEPDNDRDVEDLSLKQCHAALENTIEELDDCNQALNATVYLWVQMGDQCTIHRADGNKYKLIVKKMKDVTWQFSDRPRRIEKEISTEAFINSFDDVFTDSWPNAAVTFHTTQDDASDAPLVSVFLEAAHEDDNLFDEFLSVTYMLDQSEDQEGIVSLESYFHDGQDEATFEDCSIFIDDSAVGTSAVPECPESCQNADNMNAEGVYNGGTVRKCCDIATFGLGDGAVCHVNNNGNACNCQSGNPCIITRGLCPASCQNADNINVDGDYDNRSVRKCCDQATGGDKAGTKCNVNGYGSHTDTACNCQGGPACFIGYEECSASCQNANNINVDGVYDGRTVKECCNPVTADQGPDAVCNVNQFGNACNCEGGNPCKITNVYPHNCRNSCYTETIEWEQSGVGTKTGTASDCCRSNNLGYQNGCYVNGSEDLCKCPVDDSPPCFLSLGNCIRC